jgi:DNA (cytosine-5)-methyltransferase 1
MARYLSVCSGIEAATVAWHPLGWQPLAFSEIEDFPRAVLAHHYPDVPCHGDFTALRDQPWIVDADVLVGGTPCQAFSVAGLRNSLADDRGNLSLEFVRLADAIDDVRKLADKDPAIIVWENVPGVLSVKDNAFGCFLAGLAGDVDPYVPPRGKWTNAGVVAGPQRQVAWRVLDAQYFGLAQRRRRVFVVASARDGFDPAAVLLEFEGVRRDTAPRRETGQVAPTIPSRSTAGGGLGTDFDCDGGVIKAFAGTVESDVAATIQTTCHDYSRADGFNMIAHTLKAEGFDASEDGTGRGTPLVPVMQPTHEVVGTLCAEDSPHGARGLSGLQTMLSGYIQPVAFSYKDSGADAANDLSPTLRAMPHDGSHANGGGQMAVAVPLQEVGKRTGASTDDPRAGIGIGQDGDPMFTLQAGAQHGVAAYGFQPRIARNGRGDTGDIVNALNAQSGETGKGDAAPCVAYTTKLHNTKSNQSGKIYEEYTVGLDKSSPPPALLTSMAVRRLTPTECSRLQGFPDDYLLQVTFRGKCPPADGVMYKALGNSMAVPVMRWIGKRIANALA